VCNAGNMGVTLMNCTAQCGSCPQALGTHTFNQCTQGAIGTHSVFNLGLHACDAIITNYFNSSNCAPNTLAASISRAQGECAWGDTMQCALPPYVNTQPTQAVTQVLVQSCPQSSVQGPFCVSNQCNITVRDSGVCFEGTGNVNWPANSSRYTCLGGARCASFMLWTGTAANPATQCNANPSDIFTAVCNSCFKNRQGTFNRLMCDGATRVATLFENCDNNCLNCQGSALRPEDVCSAGLQSGTFIMNRGMFPCSAVQVQHFAGTGCDQTTAIVNFTQNVGQCNFGDTYHCGTYNFPNVDENRANVTERDCRCGGFGPNSGGQSNGICPAPKMYLEASCQPRISHFRFPNSSYTVSCNKQPALCATAHQFRAPDCAGGYQGRVSIQCGSCMEDFDGGHFRLTCDYASQTVTVLQQCDATCSNCAPITAPNVYPLEKCVQSGSGYLLSSGIAPCTTATLMNYFNTTGCGGSPSFVQTVAQGQCEDAILCSNAPTLPTAPAASTVLMTVCPWNPTNPVGVCAGDQCTVTTVPTNTCVKDTLMSWDAMQFYHKMTCQTQPGWCGSFSIFNNSASCGERAFMGITSFACNQCMYDSFRKMYLRISCSNGAVTATNCSDASCKQCPANTANPLTMTLQPQACTRDTVYDAVKPAGDTNVLYLRYQSLYQCNTVQVDVYQNAQCSGSAINNVIRPMGACANGVRLTCGNNFNVPTPAPTMASTIVFTIKLAAPYDGRLFAAALTNAVPGANIQDVVIMVSPDRMTVNFYFIGASAATQQALLQKSIGNNAQQTASYFGGSSIGVVANSPTPGPNGASPSDDKSSSDTVKIVGIIVGAVVGIALIGGVVFFLSRRQAAAGRRSAAGGSVNVKPQDVEEPMYEHYRDGTF
jgi:hypothetical protein